MEKIQPIKRSFALNRYITDFCIMNLVTFLVSAITYLLGKDFFSAFMLLLLVESSVALIIGGVYGSIVSSASFHGIDRYFKRAGFGKLKVEVPSIQKDQEEKELKNEIERTKREVRMGKRFVILGATLLLESIFIALILMI
ncbi:MAG: hypothetical protein N3D12_04630 [Candidatus Methanomethyliaceae archaeon]|nr:hypothetical protein [Candidatus Methanomethyliaceae archaeon]